MDACYEKSFEQEKHVVKLQEQYEESQITQMIENQKYHTNLQVICELNSSKCQFLLQQFRYLQHLKGLNLLFKYYSQSDYLAFNEFAQSLSFLQDLTFLSLNICKQEQQQNLSQSLSCIGKGLQSLKFLKYFNLQIDSSENLQENLIQDLSIGLASLQQLQQLKINICESLCKPVIFKQIFNSFAQLENLDILQIGFYYCDLFNNDQQIKYLSQNLKFLKNLKKLHIFMDENLSMSESSLNELNLSILTLKNIVNFKVNFYYKEEFEAIFHFINSIISIQTLEELEICLNLNLRNQSNKQLSIGESLNQVSNLKKLKLQLKNQYFIPQQRIFAFDENFYRFKNLNELSLLLSGLKVDGFKNLQSYLENNQNFTKISLQFEQQDDQQGLRYLEKALMSMKNVKDLTLSFQIHDQNIIINDFFTCLTQLNQLDQLTLLINLNFQTIDNLNECFQGLQNLKILNLSFGESQYQNIGQIMKSLKYLVNLETLFINFDQLSSNFSLQPLIESFKCLKKLRNLEIYLTKLNFEQGLFFLNREQGDNFVEAISNLNELLGFHFMIDVEAEHQQIILRKLYQSLVKNLKKLRKFSTFFENVNIQKSYLMRKHLRLVDIA